jgi:hydroxyethylthiazole kinase-like uncharacterized protein yjeF
MKNIYENVDYLDQRCYEQFRLSEDILMENAALALEKEILKVANEDTKVLVACGPGNNGADGITLARRLYKKLNIAVYLPLGAKSTMAQLQLKRAKAIGVNEVNDVVEASIVVDCIFGSGLKKDLSSEVVEIINKLNDQNSYKIACDIPTGINLRGNLSPVAFKADKTITMGALKQALFNDTTRDYIGEVVVADLGVSTKVYQDKTDTFLLEKSDMKLPFRTSLSAHKGNFGHLSIFSGEKQGASVISALSAFNFGVGLVTLVGDNLQNIPPSIMTDTNIPKKTNALVIGPGLGKENLLKVQDALNSNLPKVLDADILYKNDLSNYLNNAVLTPHLKEFSAVLKSCNLGEYTPEKIAQNKIQLAKEFSLKFKNTTLVLKGANTIIATNEKVYINNFSTPNLSKGGSGDILAGLIGSLLSQNYTLLQAALTATLTLTTLANNYKGNNFSLTSLDLIQGLKYVQ